MLAPDARRSLAGPNVATMQANRQRPRGGWGQAPCCRPGESQDPYRVIYVLGRLTVTTFFVKLRPVVMGPGFRQDDTEFAF